MVSNIELFLCYHQKDELLCQELVTYLGVLKQQGFFDVWYDREISAGTEYEQEIDMHLNTAQIILLLVSQYFMNSNYCYLNQMKRAIERHERGDAIVIPVILRPVFFQRAPFAKLMLLPTNKKPITDSSWHTLDDALFDVAEGIRKATEKLAEKLSTTPLMTLTQPQTIRAVKSLQSVLPVLENPSELVTSKIQQYRTGDRVRHDKFGEGVVVKSEVKKNDMGNDTEFVDVQFQGIHGRKRLSMQFANLEKL